MYIIRLYNIVLIGEDACVHSATDQHTSCHNDHLS